MYNPYTLEGKTILVAGASSGIGRELAIECSRLGANVHLLARDAGRLAETLSMMEEGGHVVHRCDITDESQLDKLVESLPVIDGFANCVGISKMVLVKFLNKTEPDYYHRQRVEVLVVQRSDLGYRVIVNNEHWGQIYQNETYQDINIGDRLTAFVKQVRPDGKVDVTLAKIEKMRVDDLADRILDYLKNHSGEMSLTDKSDPDDISKAFKCSKKDFKKALGQLYKQQQVTLGDTVKLV